MDTQSPPRSPVSSFSYVKPDHDSSMISHYFQNKPYVLYKGPHLLPPRFPFSLWSSHPSPLELLRTGLTAPSTTWLIPHFPCSLTSFNFLEITALCETFPVWSLHLQSHMPFWSFNSATYFVIAFITTRNISINFYNLYNTHCILQYSYPLSTYDYGALEMWLVLRYGAM